MLTEFLVSLSYMVVTVHNVLGLPLGIARLKRSLRFAGFPGTFARSQTILPGFACNVSPE